MAKHHMHARRRAPYSPYSTISPFQPVDTRVKETSVDKDARLALQKIGSTAGIHHKVLEAQIEGEKIATRRRRRIAAGNDPTKTRIKEESRS